MSKSMKPKVVRNVQKVIHLDAAERIIAVVPEGRINANWCASMRKRIASDSSAQMRAPPRPYHRRPVTPSLLARVLRRNADGVVDSSEGKLVLAVIVQAVADREIQPRRGHQQSLRDKYVIADADAFFRDGRMDVLANLIGLNPDFVREALAKYDAARTGR